MSENQICGTFPERQEKQKNTYNTSISTTVIIWKVEEKH